MYADTLAWDAGGMDENPLGAVARERLTATDTREVAEGALILMQLAFDGGANTTRAELAELAELNETALFSPDVPTHYAGAWAYVWLGQTSPEALTPALLVRITPRLLEIWSSSTNVDVQAVAAWALSYLPLTRELPLDLPPWEDLSGFLEAEWKKELNPRFHREDRRGASLVMGFVLGGPWSDRGPARDAKNTPLAGQRVAAPSQSARGEIAIAQSCVWCGW